MNRVLLSKAVLLLGLILLLVVPAAQAAEPRTSANPLGVTLGLVAWDVAAQAWDLLTSVWANNGCLIDPSGLCLPNQEVTVEADNGCRIDPDGRCAS
jgi:hypothetical protein